MFFLIFNLKVCHVRNIAQFKGKASYVTEVFNKLSNNLLFFIRLAILNNNPLVRNVQEGTSLLD